LKINFGLWTPFREMLTPASCKVTVALPLGVALGK
jgi:hypothetical protein